MRLSVLGTYCEVGHRMSSPFCDLDPGPYCEPMTGDRLADALAEATRLVQLADARGLLLRLIGGLAVQARVPGWNVDATRAAAARRDIDLATGRRDAPEVARMLGEAGYQPDRHYNALYGHKQLYFEDPTNERPVDVVVERLEMCHRLEFGPRLAADYPTLPLADLLLSKLQVVRLNPKDARDALALLTHFPVTDRDAEGINLGRVVEVTTTDWGWWRTVTGNLDLVLELVDDSVAPELHDPRVQIAAIREAIARAPKSGRWRLRARIGDRIRWYEEPEETAHERL